MRQKRLSIFIIVTVIVIRETSRRRQKTLLIRTGELTTSSRTMEVVQQQSQLKGWKIQFDQMLLQDRSIDSKSKGIIDSLSPFAHAHTNPCRWKLPILPSLLLVWYSLPKVPLELIVATNHIILPIMTTNHILLLIMTSNYILWIFSRNGGSVRTTPWCSRDFYCPYVFQVHHLTAYESNRLFCCFLFRLLRFVDSFDPLCKF